jgi:hypothetical protein
LIWNQRHLFHALREFEQYRPAGLPPPGPVAPGRGADRDPRTTEAEEAVRDQCRRDVDLVRRHFRHLTGTDLGPPGGRVLAPLERVAPVATGGHIVIARPPGRRNRLSRPNEAGRPPTVRSIRWLVLRLARENSM